MPERSGSHEQHVKAGQQSHKNEGGSQQAQGDKNKQGGGERGGSGNFKNDPERASEAGRKGIFLASGKWVSGHLDVGRMIREPSRP